MMPSVTNVAKTAKSPLGQAVTGRYIAVIVLRPKAAGIEIAAGRAGETSVGAILAVIGVPHNWQKKLVS